MRIIIDKPLRDFNFWSGGADRANNCSVEELDALEQFFEETEPEDGWTDTDINDMFWFEFDTLAQYLGYKDEEDFDRKHGPNYIDDDLLKGEIDEWFQNWLDEHTTTVNQKMIDLIVVVATDIFDYKEDLPVDDEGEYTHQAFENCLKFLREQHDEDDLYESLFEDDRGSWEAKEIPTWEDFRDEITNKLSNI